jgi:hypothetical protein
VKDRRAIRLDQPPERAVDLLEIAEREDFRDGRDGGSDPQFFQRIRLARGRGR